MKFYLLASGSKGNCMVLTDQNCQIIVDCGSTKSYLLSCMQTIQKDHRQSDALLLTHAHSDHISQLRMFLGLPVYSPFALPDAYHEHPVIPFEAFHIKQIQITPLALSHDTAITVGYVFETETSKLVYITDTGYLRQDYYKLLSNADYYILECNHDVTMLMESKRPYSLKNRILSDNGHLSNEACAQALSQLVGPATKEVILAHISEEANCPDLALSAVRTALMGHDVRIQAAGQFTITEGGSE